MSLSGLLFNTVSLIHGALIEVKFWYLNRRNYRHLLHHLRQAERKEKLAIKYYHDWFKHDMTCKNILLLAVGMLVFLMVLGSIIVLWEKQLEDTERCMLIAEDVVDLVLHQKKYKL